MASQQSLASTLPTNLPATFMKEITNDFSAEREIGHSVFGTVYEVYNWTLELKHDFLHHKILVLVIHGDKTGSSGGWAHDCCEKAR